MATNVPKVCAVVITYNQREQALACLRTLSGVTYTAWTVLLVDNGSTDGTAEVVAKSFPHVHMLRLGKNQGYVGGTNHGVARALAGGADYILLLNDDVWVPPEAPSTLVAAAEADLQTAVVGPKVYCLDEPQRIQSAGGAIDWRTACSQLIGQGELDQGQYDCSRDVEFVSGCAMLIRAQAWYAVGGFDPAYFLYYEEVDWCLRARQAGWKVTYIPWTAVWHADRTSTKAELGLVTYYTIRNRLLLAKRHAASGTQLATYLDQLWRMGRGLHTFFDPQRRPQFVATWQATWDFFRGRFGPGPYPVSAQHRQQS
jgi:GT2 family glycosyltransferase